MQQSSTIDENCDCVGEVDGIEEASFLHVPEQQRVK